MIPTATAWNCTPTVRARRGSGTASQVQMATDPIDFDSLFRELKPNDPALANPAAPDGTKLGHMHLRIGSVPKARDFYHGVLGFDMVADWPSALFMSAGGYHHHLGMNTWESSGGKRRNARKLCRTARV